MVLFIELFVKFFNRWSLTLLWPVFLTVEIIRLHFGYHQLLRANDQDRTGDLILTMDVLYRLSYIGILSPLLLYRPDNYRESYIGIDPAFGTFERKTGLEPATYSLEGYRSTK